MTKPIWVTKVTYEKNADDGIDYFTDRTKLAEHVMMCEEAGGRVQVYSCKPVGHIAYSVQAAIDLRDEHGDKI